ncbi:STAS domain-containing protein [Nocardioides sp.]|uniref:STAS domain-containing protein n=1 Tax=Nocardioides sp. TaxID=35761 RepID=UPI002736CDFC|nr:STAS domain-containing protein [Nocardioides sp.]MDP3893652.1 STAS domain-containing protein [Nocardioides sp.]
MDIIRDGPTLALAGEFDVRSTFEVRAALYDHLEEHVTGNDADVVLDLSEVTSIDVTALRVLAVATLAAERAGHHLRLRGCGPAVRRMIHLSRLARHVDVEREAVSA